MGIGVAHRVALSTEHWPLAPLGTWQGGRRFLTFAACFLLATLRQAWFGAWSRWRVDQWFEPLLTLFYPGCLPGVSGRTRDRGEGYVGGNCRKEVHYIVPPNCERCGLPFDGAIMDTFECGNCQEMRLAFQSGPRGGGCRRDGAGTSFIAGNIRESLWFEPFLTGLLLREAVPALRTEHWDLIVAMPLHRDKETEREFNQAQHLAQALGAATGLRVERRFGSAHGRDSKPRPT